jgi:hypothetical protein
MVENNIKYTVPVASLEVSNDAGIPRIELKSRDAKRNLSFK